MPAARHREAGRAGAHVRRGSARGGRERRRRRFKDAGAAAVTCGRGGGPEHGGVNPGELRPSRRPICGEVEEDAAAELPACLDSCGEGRGGGAARRRWRDNAGVAGERRERGGSDDVFTKSTLSFPVIFYRSFLLRSCGLRVRFSVLRGAFLQKRHRRVLGAVGSTADGADFSGTVATVHLQCVLFQEQ